MAEGTLLDGRYRLEHRVGQGATGVVYEAFDTESEGRVAVKVLHDEGSEAANSWTLRRLQREIGALRRISHPNVVSLRDTGLVHERPYLVMEWLGGVDLVALRELAGPLFHSAAGALARQLVDGLAATHRASVLHRDVKPSNVRVTTTGRAVLCDLGLARLRDATSLTRAGQVMGTPRYMAPELIRGEPPTQASDFYGIGLCLHELIVGRRPFDHREDIGALLLSVLDEGVTALDPARYRDRVPTGLIELVNGWCDRDPERRPTSAALIDGLLPAVPPGAAASRLRDLIAHATARRESGRGTTDAWARVSNADTGVTLRGSDLVTHAVAGAEAVSLTARNTPGARDRRPPMLSLGDVTQALVLHRITPRNAASRLREAVGMAQRGESREALDLLATIGTVGAEQLGPGDPTTLTARFWQAVCLARLGSSEEALALLATVNAHTGPAVPPDDGEPPPAPERAAPAPEKNEKGDPG
ncbi:Serine/threonine protein kinase [Streptomyces zhaozhouensis]|uniref:non-specific serine/threonine protein kinase n=1 Tax=Streptomyces zhaozhouensis TaxID=1300267 RepID=A0A286DVJ4_9ACTN|nr:serine/threonine-protein kinase [Streptomyces zhaozhouensis]SOD62656.1 Serine/threonine protein kinase [Streptomyces zhaozhouensis]